MGKEKVPTNLSADPPDPSHPIRHVAPQRAPA